MSRTSLRMRICFGIIALVVIVMIGSTAVRATYFGTIMIDLDLSEQSDAKAVESAKKKVISSCAQFINEFGFRQYCRKLLSENAYKEAKNRQPNELVDSNLRDVLRISPLEPAYWLALSDDALTRQKNLDDAINYLRMSYVTGRSQQMLMSKRFSIALALWDDLDASDKSIAINDFIHGSKFDRDDMLKAIRLLNSDQKLEIHQLLSRRNTELADELKTIELN